jgi:hypothetical protein
LPVLPIRTGGSDKVSRAHAVSPLVEAGKVFLPESAPWLADFLDEATSFPSSAHDDQIDSLTQVLGWLRGSRGWQASDGGYIPVPTSTWSQSSARRGMTVAQRDAWDDRQNDIERMRRNSGLSGRFMLRKGAW